MKRRSMLAWVISFIVWGTWVATAGIWWKDHDGNTGSYASNTWDNLQAAINNAQNGLPTGQMGEVRISGDVTRTAGDVTTHLDVSGSGNIKISGGWNSNWTEQTSSVRSVLNANGASLLHSNRVMYVATTNVWLDNLWLKQGRRSRAGCGLLATNAHHLVVSDCIVSDNRADVGLFPGSLRAYGAGINISDSNDVKLRHMVIADNYMGGGYSLMSRGTAAYIQNSGTASDPVILEYCHIAENVGGSYSTLNGSGLVIFGNSRVTVANSRFYKNAPAANGQGIYVDGTTAKVVVFGSLFDGNRDRYWNTGGNLISAINVAPEGLVLANCTFVDNGPIAAAHSDPYITARSGVTANTNMSLLMINCLVGVTNALTPERHILYSYRDGSDTKFGHFLFQNTTFSEDSEPSDTNTWFRASATYMYDLSDALSTLVGGRYRFHALDANGNLVPNPGAGDNREETIDFVTVDDLSGSTPLQRKYKYSVPRGSSSSMSGALKNPGTYQYIDVDHDGVFDADLDIVVGGSAPSNAKYVFKYDLRFLGRVTKSGATPNITYSFEPGTVLATGLSPSEMGYGGMRASGTGIDRGCYQVLLPRGMVLVIR